MSVMLESLLNDLSMLVMLLDPASPEGEWEPVRAALREIEKCVPSDARLCSATVRTIEVLTAEERESRHSFLCTYLSTAQAYLANPATKLVHEMEVPQSDVGGIVDRIDSEFLVEFIEKHTTMLEEFEGAILAFQASAGKSAPPPGATIGDFHGYVKGYLHNIKGDAGSIGLHSVEQVCHQVEDILVTTTADCMVDRLLAVREWIGDVLRALTEKRPYREQAEGFLQRFAGIPERTSDRTEAVPQSVRKTSPSAAPEAYRMTGEVEIFQDFAVEADDHLNSVESLILDAGESPDSATVDSMFRSIHSIKGSSSYFGLKEITTSSHALENLMDEVRDGKRRFDSGLKDLVLRYLDLQRTLLKRAKDACASGGAIVPTEDTGAFLTQLSSYEAGGSICNQEVPKQGALPMVAESVPNPPTAKPGTLHGPSQRGESGDEGKEKLDVKTFVKVDTKRLDQLIDAIGEMSIYSSMLIQNCRTLLAGNAAVTNMSHQVEKVAKDLQNIGMSMRLIPIRGLFQKMSRLVWDLSKKVGKDVRFEMEGEDTELDRTIIDKLADPLMHMIRNALDHGVEPPEDRTKVGKPAQGRVRLSAYHAGGAIHIRIEDDGRGLDPEKLIKKAIEKGILKENQRPSREEAYHLIFAAGFSTAAVVTDISGRGVGMDVVKRNIESLRGRIHITSNVGSGTTFTIELPLTLAIMDGIEIAVGAERFIIPTLSVIEFMRPSREAIAAPFDRGETFLFRGKYLPVFRLGRLFGVQHRSDDPTNSIFVVLESVGEQYVLMVDEIVGSYSTVIKSLGDVLEGNKGLAGCSIMSNGEIALILDVQSLLQLARTTYTFRSDCSVSTGEPAHVNQ